MPGLGGTTNNYEILAQLASGGMAEIFLARVTAVGGVERHVVLKRILPSYKDDQEFVTMFLDEARLQAQLRHPNIAQLHDVGRLGSSYFYTMEYVHGETLQSIANKTSGVRDHVPLAHVLTIGAGVTSALHHAHTRIGPDRKPLNIVHRDVTPANVMITFDGVVKLLDFGVAKSQGRRMQETRAGVVKGKVAYLAPEQIQGKPLDGRCDLFSLGITLYELLTLHQLFARPSDLDTLTAIIREQVPPPSYFRKDVPPEIDQIVMTALSKDPAQRFPNADAMHEAIEHAASRARLSMSPSSLGRYISKLFGQRPEPWLDFEALAPVTVMGDIIPPTEGVVVPASLFPSPQAQQQEALIQNVPKVHVGQFDETSDFSDDKTAYRPRPTLPMAAADPNWEESVEIAPMPSGVDLENLMTPPAVRLPPGALQADPATTLPLGKAGDLATTLPITGRKPQLPAPAAPVEMNRPVQQRPQSQAPFDPLRSSGGHAFDPLRSSGGQAFDPLRSSHPRAPSPLPVRANSQWQKPAPAPGTSWNIPRVVMAIAILIAIIVAVVLALS